DVEEFGGDGGDAADELVRAGQCDLHGAHRPAPARNRRASARTLRRLLLGLVEVAHPPIWAEAVAAGVEDVAGEGVPAGLRPGVEAHRSRVEHVRWERRLVAPRQGTMASATRSWSRPAATDRSRISTHSA